MRSWMWASARLARVVTIVQVRSGSTSGRPRHVAHSPAKANGSPSGRVTHHGCVVPSGRFSHS